GSLGVDVETAIDVTLLDNKVVLIPTTANGPLYHENSLIGGLLLGRSSTSRQGVIVLPGVIDSDYTGNIKIMAYTLNPPISIPKGSRIAQIVALRNCQPSCNKAKTNCSKTCGQGGLGSTGPAVTFTQELSDRPTQKIIMQNGLQEVKLYPLLDTGADVTIIN
ncbi:POK9 protein, partial [Chionis minor]|nr:POK9 protein [Chionis minor]